MHKPSSLRDYVISGIIALALTVFLGFYLFIRRGYLFDAPPTADPFYVPNKAIASAGMILLAFTFLIGPIARYFDRFDHWVSYRKELGIVAAFLLFVHGIGSYLWLPLKYPREYLFDGPFIFGAGFLGVFVLLFLFVISFKKAIEFFGAGRWWFLQRWGLRLVVIFTLIHVYGMKWQGWWKWIKQGATQTPELANPLMTPASLLAGLFIGWVVIVRLYEMLFLYKTLGFITTKEISIDPEIRVRGRKFFVRSAWILVALYVVVITRFWW